LMIRRGHRQRKFRQNQIVNGIKKNGVTGANFS
jgi:hypothetical protein